MRQTFLRADSLNSADPTPPAARADRKQLRRQRQQLRRMASALGQPSSLASSDVEAKLSGHHNIRIKTIHEDGE